jgi:hypothetical protein
MAADPIRGAHRGFPRGSWSVSVADLNRPPVFSTPPLTPGWTYPDVALVPGEAVGSNTLSNNADRRSPESGTVRDQRPCVRANRR